nr:ORF89 [Acipenserid herpesvirus 1]
MAEAALKYLLGDNYKNIYAQLYHIECRLYREHTHLLEKIDLSKYAKEPLMVLVNAAVKMLEMEESIPVQENVQLQSLSLAHSPFTHCCVKTSPSLMSPENREYHPLATFDPSHQHVSLARLLQTLSMLNYVINATTLAVKQLQKLLTDNKISSLTRMHINLFIKMAACLPLKEKHDMLTHPKDKIEWQKQGEVAMSIVLACCSIIKCILFYFHGLAVAIVASISTPLCTVSIQHAKARLRLQSSSCWPTYLLNVLKMIQ